ncbi:glycosyltransferase family 29 protein [Salinibacter ruber]|uniref:glycosyltransferase family 29 protein n=1 Tax=Salinibacter ruber TaxID=146919 RepID=UPI00216A2946|nr:glycosyltransferase family 29 protein [Salinibacter ruber]MCS3783582.1 hypothetical protein [Salinibacter ruber]
MEYKKFITSIKKRLTNKAKRISKSIHGSIADPYIKNKIKKGNLEIPSNIIQEKKSVKRKYPKISPFYPDSTFKEELSERAKHFETASVVFNSGKALKNENGSEIDDKGVVFRINFMPTRGFEKKVGSRTTVRVLGREWLFSEKDEILVRTYCKKEYIEKEYNNYKRSEKLRKTIKIF